MLAVVSADNVPVVVLGLLRAVVPLFVVRCGGGMVKDTDGQCENDRFSQLVHNDGSVQIEVGSATSGSVSVVAGDPAARGGAGAPFE